MPIVAALALAACTEPDAPAAGSTTADPGSDRQTAFRVRADFDRELNADRGWAAGLDEPAVVTADRPFRLRFEVAAADDGVAVRRFGLQLRHNGGDWRPLPAEDFPYPEKVVELEPGDEPPGTGDGTWRFARGDAAQIRRTADHWRVDTGDRALLALARYDVHWQPDEFTVALRLPDQPAARAGVVFAERRGGGFLAVEAVRPDRVRVVAVDDGPASVLAEHRAALEPGRWIELNLVVGAAEVTVALGDEALEFTQRLPDPVASPRLGVYLPENSRADFGRFVVEAEARTPRSSIVSSPDFDHGAPTEDVLTASDRPFTGGAGIDLAERTPPWTADGGHGEWEFPIVIRRFADEAALNEAGDRFDYRLVSGDGDPLPADALASVTLEVPDGHLGGTFVETPMRIGPWQAADGNLYFIMEPSETWNRLMVVQSTDGGRTWREVDGGHRPETGDLEGLGSAFVDGRIHILHQVSDAVLYHAFDTSDRSDNPDAWAVRDERVAAPPQPPTQVADLAVRSDGSVLAVHGSADGIRIATRTSNGEWTEAHRIDGPDDAVPSGPTVVKGAGDAVHLAYSAGPRALYRTLAPDGSLSDALEIADDLAVGDEHVGAIAPLLYLPDSDRVSAIYRAADGRLYERRISRSAIHGEPVAVSERVVAQSPVDSDQVVADAVVHGDGIHVLFVEQATGHLHHAIRRDGRWRDAAAVVTDADVQWVRGRVIEGSDGEPVYGFVYDAGSNGGSGMNRFAQAPLTR